MGGPYLVTEGVEVGPSLVKVEVAGVPCRAEGVGVEVVGASLGVEGAEEVGELQSAPEVLVVVVEEVGLEAGAVVAGVAEGERHMVVSEETFGFCLAFL